MDEAIEKIKAIQENARKNNDPERPKWQMIVLRTPKGWTGPKVVDGQQIEGSFRAHQVPITMEKPEEHLPLLQAWLESYHAEELFDEKGRLIGIYYFNTHFTGRTNSKWRQIHAWITIFYVSLG